jgi:hypothetical protein
VVESCKLGLHLGPTQEVLVSVTAVEVVVSENGRQEYVEIDEAISLRQYRLDGLRCGTCGVEELFRSSFAPGVIRS